MASGLMTAKQWQESEQHEARVHMLKEIMAKENAEFHRLRKEAESHGQVREPFLIT